MANDPKIDCRVKLDLFMLNTTRAEMKYATEFYFQRTVVEKFEDAKKKEWQRNTRLGKLKDSPPL